jgi:hypothetical protein
MKKLRADYIRGVLAVVVFRLVSENLIMKEYGPVAPCSLIDVRPLS